MGLREFKLPNDLSLLIDVLPPSFQYPENPTWNTEADEETSLVDTLQGMRKLWPVLRVVQMVHPPLRDALRGYIWEEDGKAVGVSNVLRMGATDQWLIGNVSVLPDYRRRGIARKLVAATVEYAKARGAKRILLDVVEGNLPAYTLYQRLGFDDISRESILVRDGDGSVDPLPLPAEYTMAPSTPFEWQPRFALAKRITPENVGRYKPVEEGRFRQPAILRPVLPLVFRATGARTQGYLVRHVPDGLVVAHGRIHWRTRPGGTNTLGLTLDPAHGAIASAVVTALLYGVLTRSPGRRIELSVPDWQPDVIAAAQAAGFCSRYEIVSMGMIPG